MKKWTALLLVSAIVLSLCACGSSNASAIETQQAESSDVQLVIDAINAIGEVSTESGALIETAESYYNILSDSEKSQVSNRFTLVEARDAYDKLLLEEEQGADAVLTDENWIDINTKTTLSFSDGLMTFNEADGGVNEYEYNFNGTDLTYTYVGFLGNSTVHYTLEEDEDTGILTLVPPVRSHRLYVRESDYEEGRRKLQIPQEEISVKVDGKTTAAWKILELNSENEQSAYSKYGRKQAEVISTVAEVEGPVTVNGFKYPYGYVKLDGGWQVQVSTDDRTFVKKLKAGDVVKVTGEITDINSSSININAINAQETPYGTTIELYYEE
jgi:hypothetical protein